MRNNVVNLIPMRVTVSRKLSKLWPGRDRLNQLSHSETLFPLTIEWFDRHPVLYVYALFLINDHQRFEQSIDTDYPIIFHYIHLSAERSPGFCFTRIHLLAYGEYFVFSL